MPYLIWLSLTTIIIDKIGWTIQSLSLALALRVLRYLLSIGSAEKILAWTRQPQQRQGNLDSEAKRKTCHHFWTEIFFFKLKISIKSPPRSCSSRFHQTYSKLIFGRIESNRSCNESFFRWCECIFGNDWQHGQWLWLNWLSGRFQLSRSGVRFPSTCPCIIEHISTPYI